MDEPVFRTPVRTKAWSFQIGHRSGVVALGSCFADSIGNRLKDSKFKVSVNPGGIIYNPLSIHRLIGHAVSGTAPGPDAFLERDGRWYCYDVHSSVFSDHPDTLHQNLKRISEDLHRLLSEAGYVMITYGTAWIHRRRDNGDVVANCHKVPSHRFERSLLSEDEVVTSFHSMRESLLSINPRLRFILTVSPVRHLADTAEGNQVSKSVLRLACHRITERCDEAVYFPAYEIMMDDLRDYRFYAADMIHPSETALDYIWSVFQRVAFSLQTRDLIERWMRVRKSLTHRPFHPKSETHRTFLQELHTELIRLSGHLDVSQEIAELERYHDYGSDA